MELIKKINNLTINIDGFEKLNSVANRETIKLFKTAKFSPLFNYIKLSNMDMEIINYLNSQNFKYKIIEKKEIGKKPSKLFNRELINSRTFLINKFKIHNVLLSNHYCLKKVSPFKIPIEKSNENDVFGYLGNQLIKNSSQNKYVYTFDRIILPKRPSNFTGIIYTHEIVHTQLYNNLESVNYWYNNEVLPIFVEFLYAYKSKDNETFFARVEHLTSSVEEIIKYNKDELLMDENLIDNISSYISIVTAFKLFNIYLNGNTAIKKEILDNIQKVFDFKINLEDMLNTYDLDWSKTEKKVINHN